MPVPLLVHGWLLATDTVPDGAVEAETSLYERVNLGPLHERSTALLLTPTIGLTPCLELALPIELVTRTIDDAAPWSGIARYGAELRYRFLHTASLHPIARFAMSRDVVVQTQIRSEIELAASYDIERVRIEADAGFVADFNFGHLHTELRPGLGASIEVTSGLRLGAELFVNHSMDPIAPSWAVAGPDVSWVHGRFWLAGVAGVGIENITAAPRLNLGLVW